MAPTGTDTVSSVSEKPTTPSSLSDRGPVLDEYRTTTVLFRAENTIPEDGKPASLEATPALWPDFRILLLLGAVIALLSILPPIFFPASDSVCVWCQKMNFWHLNDPYMINLTSNGKHYVEDHVLPYVWPFLQKCFMMEGWRRVWTFLGISFPRVFRYLVAPIHNSYLIKLLPKWAYRIYDFVDRALQRGTGILFRRTTERLILCCIKNFFISVSGFVEQSLVVLFLTSAALRRE
jgi:hypothetical protein